MVKEINHKDKTYYQCEACGFYYKTQDIAKKCEDFCNKYKSCSIDITKHAVKLK